MKDCKTPEEELYLEYFNNYLTIEKMAEHKGVDPEILETQINKGRIDHFYRTCRNKTAQGR